MESVPLSKDIKESTLVSIERTIPLYGFKDTCKVDWEAEIKKLRQKENPFEIDFYRDLLYLFQGLEDAHTFYYPPGPNKCYRTFNFIQVNLNFSFLISFQNKKFTKLQPFIPISYFSEQTKENKVEIFQIRKLPYAESVAEAYKRFFFIFFLIFQLKSLLLSSKILKKRLHDLEVNQYAGCFIQKMDGMDITKYFVDKLDRQIGASKDRNIRWNMAIDKYLMHRPQDRFTTPDKSVIYELKCPHFPAESQIVTITVPWIAFTTLDVNSSEELTQSCQTKAQVQENSERINRMFQRRQRRSTPDKLIFRHDEMYDLKTEQNDKKMMAFPSKSFVNGENTLEEIYTGDKVHFYIATTPLEKFAGWFFSFPFSKS